MRLSCRAYDAGYQYVDAQQEQQQTAQNIEQMAPQFEQQAMRTA